MKCFGTVASETTSNISVRPFRLGFLTGSVSFYAPLTLFSLDPRLVDTGPVWMKERRRSRLASLRRMARQSGWRYAFDRGHAALPNRQTRGLSELLPSPILIESETRWRSERNSRRRSATCW